MFGFLLYTLVFECCAISFVSKKMGIEKNCCFLIPKMFIGMQRRLSQLMLAIGVSELLVGLEGLTMVGIVIMCSGIIFMILTIRFLFRAIKLNDQQIMMDLERLDRVSTATCHDSLSAFVDKLTVSQSEDVQS
jgi:Zn-dependent membrane protease YugP